MTMHVLDRPGIARRVSKTCAPIAAVAAVVAGLTAFALPAGAATALPSTTYSVTTVLSGKTLHHQYTKTGSSAEFSEPLTKPDDITRVGGDLFTAFQNGVGPEPVGPPGQVRRPDRESLHRPGGRHGQRGREL
jgi:hypothetical protein